MEDLTISKSQSGRLLQEGLQQRIALLVLDRNYGEALRLLRYYSTIFAETEIGKRLAHSLSSANSSEAYQYRHLLSEYMPHEIAMDILIRAATRARNLNLFHIAIDLANRIVVHSQGNDDAIRFYGGIIFGDVSSDEGKPSISQISKTVSNLLSRNAAEEYPSIHLTIDFAASAAQVLEQVEEVPGLSFSVISFDRFDGRSDRLHLVVDLSLASMPLIARILAELLHEDGTLSLRARGLQMTDLHEETILKILISLVTGRDIG